jgi:hypothetical protein
MSIIQAINTIKNNIELDRCKPADLRESVKTARELYLDTKKISPTPFNRLITLDPTIEQSDEGKPIGGKYIEWMVRTYIKNHMHYGDISKFGTLKDFDGLCNKNKIEKKDINQYQTVEQVYDEVKKHEDIKSQGEIEREIKHEGAEVVFENDVVLVIKPKTREASCFYGKGTKWCTAGDVYNYFNDYFFNRGVNLYYVIPKTGKNTDKIAVAVDPDGSKEYFKSDDQHLDDDKAKYIFKSLGILQHPRKPRPQKT